MAPSPVAARRTERAVFRTRLSPRPHAFAHGSSPGCPLQAHQSQRVVEEPVGEALRGPALALVLDPQPSTQPKATEVEVAETSARVIDAILQAVVAGYTRTSSSRRKRTTSSMLCSQTQCVWPEWRLAVWEAGWVSHRTMHGSPASRTAWMFFSALRGRISRPWRRNRQRRPVDGLRLDRSSCRSRRTQET